MTDCETFEVELEMHAHGALDASRVGPLEAHLAQCGSCRRYQALMRRTESTMSTQTLDFAALKDRIFSLQRYRRNRTWFALGVPTAMGCALAVLTGHPVLSLVSTVPLALVVFAVFRLRMMAETREAIRLGNRNEALVAHYRRMLERRMRRIRVLLVMIPLFAALTFAEVAVWHVWPASMNQPLVFVVMGAALGGAFLQVLLLRLRMVPKMQKELRDLESQ